MKGTAMNAISSLRVSVMAFNIDGKCVSVHDYRPLDIRLGLNFDTLREANVKRCESAFHKLDDWTPSDWATAMGGECGEALNMVKKLRRLQDGKQLANIPSNAGDIVAGIGKELADLVIYADLLAARLGIDLGNAVMDKFNEVSDRVSSDIKL